MSWSAYVGGTDFNVGVPVTIEDGSQYDDYVLHDPPAGTLLNLFFVNKNGKAEVIEATNADITVEADGVRWKLTPAHPGEVGNRLVNTGMKNRDWLIRERR